MEQHLTERVGKLETRADETDKKIKNIDDNHTRIWERLDMHRDVQIETKTKVEEVGKDVNKLDTKMEKLVDTQSEFIQTLSKIQGHATSEWKKFWERAFLIVLSVIFSMLLGHVFHVPL